MRKEIKGRDVLVEIYDVLAAEYTPVICCDDCSISIRPEIIESTSVSTGRGIARKVRRIDWSVSLSGINTILGDGWTAFKTVTIDNILAGYQLRMTFTDEWGNAAVFTGAVVLESASLSGPVEDFSAFENEMPGNGLYTLVIDDTNSGPSSGCEQRIMMENSGWLLTESGDIMMTEKTCNSYSTEYSSEYA